MEYLAYGETGLEISRLCFGAGHLNNTCENYDAGGKLMLKALDEGITFWDTAEGYGSQPHLGEAVRQINRKEVVIQTKTGAKDYEGAKASITRSLQEMQTDYLDVLLLHGISSPEDLYSAGRRHWMRFERQKLLVKSESSAARRTSTRVLSWMP